MAARGWGPKKITRKQREANATNLVFFCKEERLATLTAEEVARFAGVPVEQAQRLLDGAREGRANG